MRLIQSHMKYMLGSPRKSTQGFWDDSYNPFFYMKLQ
jgi:hypothetical protein